MHRGDKIEIQRGPIDLSEQYSNAFKKEPKNTMQDIRDNEMRFDMRTLTKHEPKR